MKTTLKMTTILAGLLTLTACGGGGGSGGGSALLDDPSFDVLAAAFDSSIEAIGLDEDDFELEPESPDTLLVPGSATYTGQIAVLLGDAIDDEDIEDVADADILGQVELDVTFTNTGGTLSGQMQDFVGNDGEDYSGIVDIAEADLEVSTTGVGVSTTVEGTLTDQDSDSIDVDGELIGAFGEGDVFVGVSVGEVTSDEGTEEFLGVLIATD